MPPQPKPKKAWPLILAWITYILSVIAFIYIGPKPLLGGYGTDPSKAHGYTLVIGINLICATPVLLILSAISHHFTRTRFPDKLKTVQVLLSGPLLGLIFAWLFTSLTHLIYSIVLSIISLTPLVIIIAHRLLNKHNY